MNGFHGGGIAPRGVPASVTSFGFGGHPGVHGVPASVTSIGFGGHPGFHGVPASVTSLGFGARPALRGFPDGDVLLVSAHGIVFTSGRLRAGITTISMASTAPTMADIMGTYYPYPYYVYADDYNRATITPKMTRRLRPPVAARLR